MKRLIFIFMIILLCVPASAWNPPTYTVPFNKYASNPLFASNSREPSAISNSTFDYYVYYDDSTSSILERNCTNGYTCGAATTALTNAIYQYTYKDGSTYRMLNTNLSLTQIRLATSSTGISFADQGTLLTLGSAGQFDETKIADPSEIKIGSTYYLFYTGFNASNAQWIGVASSSTGAVGSYTKLGKVTISGTSPQSWDVVANNDPNPVQYGTAKYLLFYTGYDGTTQNIGFATNTTDITVWTKSAPGPIMWPTQSWEGTNGVREGRWLLEGNTYKGWYSTDQVRIGYVTIPQEPSSGLPSYGIIGQFGNVTTYTVNITAGAGAQTNYPVRFILSNASGISGYYGQDNIVYTNGTTRADWVDINATDGSGNPIPFWIEQNTQTATNATAHVNIPSIAVGNTTQAKWYYGNSSQTLNTMNGYNTFTFFDDFLGTSRNTTQFTTYGSVTTTYSGGIVTIGSSSGSAGLNSTSLFGTNFSFVGRGKFSTSAGSFGFADSPSDVNLAASYGTATYKFATKAGGSYTNSGSSADTNYHVLEVDRNSNVNVTFKYDGAYAYTSSTNFATVPEYIRYDVGATNTQSQDWAIVKKYTFPEPFTSSYSTGPFVPPGDSIVSAFTPNATTGYAYPWYVSFTDTSTGSPTTWNWTFGDSYTSTLQNPQHVYPVAGAYTVSLNVTNATGGFSNSSQTLTLTTDDDTYLHSWMHFNTSITAGEKGVAWTNTGCSLDTVVKKFGAGSLLCTNGNNFISSASSPSWDLSPTANEVEFWVNVSAMGAAGKPLISRSTGIGTTNGWGIYSSDGTATGWKYWEGNSATNSSASFTLPLNTWTHVEISKNATYVDIRLNGVNAVSYAHTGVYNTVNPFVIGASGAGNEHTFNMDEFRFSSGVPRFTQDFSNSLMKVQYVGSLTGGIDTSPNSTFRYKTDPAFPSTIANQTNGGTHNRTVQVQNMTEANYVLGSVIWDPLRQFGMAVRLNLTDYPDLVLVSSNIDNVNGEASFNVSRGGTNKITALFNNRTNLVDVQMLYWNYTSDTTGFQFFGDGMIINGTTVAPIHNFIQTNITFAPWDFYPNFSASTTTPITGQTVTFYDNTTGYPSAWNWSWGDGTWTNGTLTPSATHVYTTTGLKTVKMVGTLWQNYSITNTSTKTNYINVSASPSFTYQDIWMTGRYNQTFTVTDSQTGAPIPGVVISDANGQSFTAPTGTGYLTEPAGVFVAYFVATGYVSKSVSYIVDGDATHAVQMTASTGTPQQNTWYTPWQVRIRIVDYYGMPLSNINVTANYIASTLPSTDTSWLVTAFGISSTVANDMVNSAKAMEGVTDDNGGLSFTMFKSLQYRLTITNTTLSVASTKTLYPSDQEYVIYVRTAGQGTANNTLAMRNGTLPWYSLNSTHISLNMTYVDTSLCTSQLVFRVWFRDNGTEVHNTTWSGFGASYVYDNHTVPKAPIGTEYLWGYNATTVC